MQWKIALAAIAGIVLLIGLPFAYLEFRAQTMPFVGSRQAEGTIESAPNRIAAYERFFDICASIEGYEQQITALEDQLASAESADERERIRASIAGLRGQRSRAIADYNSESSQEYTAARFKSSDLPWRLEEDKETVCNASYND